jgi:hypothetical protein
MEKKMKTHKVYIDAGHGWMAVKRSELIDLGILDKITRCSYERGNTVYLEEDLDAITFVNAYEKKYGVRPVCDVKHSNTDRSPIRSYQVFLVDYIPE